MRTAKVLGPKSRPFFRLETLPDDIKGLEEVVYTLKALRFGMRRHKDVHSRLAN